MNYGIIGSAIYGNRGAAAMLESAIVMIRELDADAKFHLFSLYPDQDRSMNEWPDLSIVSARVLRLVFVINLFALVYFLLPPLRRLVARKCDAIGTLVDCDIMLDQSGISFVDGRDKFLLYNLATLLPALLVGTRIIKCAQAMGPFEHRLNRLAARWLLPRCTRIFSRGSLTHAYLAKLGLDNVERSTDLAFGLPDLRPEGRIPEMRPAFRDHKRKLVAICPSSVVHRRLHRIGKNYPGMIAELVDGLVEDGYQVIVIPHSARPGEDNSHNNDLPVCREILRTVRRSADCQLRDDSSSYQALRREIAKCEFLVTSRFHGMISALSSGVPTLVVGWSHKYAEILEDFDLTHWVVQDFDAETALLMEKIEEMQERRSRILQAISSRLPQQKSLARSQVQRIVKIAREKG